MKRRSFLCVCLCLLFACSAAAQEVPQLLEPAGVQLSAVAAWIGDLSSISVYEASVVPYTEAFWFEQEGTVAEVHVTPGQLVKAGDALVTLKTEAQEKRLEAVQKEIEQLQTNGHYEDELAQIDLEILDVQLRALMKQNPRDDAAVVLKQLEMEEKQLDMELNARLRQMTLVQLENERRSLEEELQENVMTAPFDGRVMYMNAQLKRGSYISAYTPLLYLADDTRLFVESAYVSNTTLASAHAMYAHIGDRRYAVTPMPVDEKEYLSKVLAGETLMVRFSIDEPDETLAAGQYAAVCVETNFMEDVLLVPTNTLYLDGTRYLYVMENGVRVRRDVKTGVSTDWYTQIVEGLQEGELVYVKE